MTGKGQKRKIVQTTIENIWGRYFADTQLCRIGLRFICVLLIFKVDKML